MTSRCLPSLVVATLLASPAPAAAATLQRFTLIVGANSGGADRVQLKYAISDAERFARVMVELGGVDPDNEVVLKDPTVTELVAALGKLRARLAAAQRDSAAAGGRVEVFIYYSGHADEKGLLLKADRLSYETLRDQLDSLPADVRIAVLDACASGAFTRLKGGRKRPPFLIDESASMRGHAILTSSAENESAQESDRIRSSYFTHYLLSGFRGAADASGDGRVTLNEAYEFAFRETVGRTVDTKGGAQHPSYDINLSGAGDVVITDVRQTTARVVLGDKLEGRFYILAARGLIVELYKPAGTPVDIALEPGSYEVRVERDKTALSAKVQLGDGSVLELNAAQFAEVPKTITQSRGGTGGSDLGRFNMDGRNVLMFQTGFGGMNDLPGFDVHAGLHYAHYFRDDLALTVGLLGFVNTEISTFDFAGGGAMPIGVNWYPLDRRGAGQFVKPYLAAALLPVWGTGFGRYDSSTLGLHTGAGLEFYTPFAIAFKLGLGYNAVPRSGPYQDNFGGLQTSFGLGFAFGRHP